jgi:hypothetical protein
MGGMASCGKWQEEEEIAIVIEASRQQIIIVLLGFQCMRDHRDITLLMFFDYFPLASCSCGDRPYRSVQQHLLIYFSWYILSPHFVLI